MTKVRIVVLPSLAETLGVEVTGEEFASDLESQGGRSVRDLLIRLGTRYFRFNQLVFDIHTQKLTGQVIIFLNGRALDPHNGLETNLHDGDTLTFVPFVEGG